LKALQFLANVLFGIPTMNTVGKIKTRDPYRCQFAYQEGLFSFCIALQNSFYLLIVLFRKVSNVLSEVLFLLYCRVLQESYFVLESVVNL
jgi:hypothetical protein